FTELYLFDRPIQGGFTIYTQKFNFNQARQEAILTGQQINLPSPFLQNLQNYTQSSAGFTTSVSYQLHHSFKRVGLTYAFDRSSLVAVSDSSKILFTNLAFRGISGPNSLSGIITSKLLPNFSFSTIDSPLSPHSGQRVYLAGEIAGLGGTVRSVRPILQYTRWTPVQTIVFSGGDLQLATNLEYRIYIAGPVALVPFLDTGINPILRNSQLRINPGQLANINNSIFGCPALDIALNCTGGQKPGESSIPLFSQNLHISGDTHWVPRMSTGLEFQVFL